MNLQVFDNDIYGIQTNFAAPFANRASELIRQLIADKHEIDVQTKSSINDLITDIDRRSETLIRELIAKHFPEDTVLAKEGIEGINPVESDINAWWIVNPLDGMANFVCQVPVINGRNTKRIISFLLVLASIVVLSFGLFLAFFGSVVGIFVVLWRLNGLFQTIGGLASCNTIYRWVPRTKRSTSIADTHQGGLKVFGYLLHGWSAVFILLTMSTAVSIGF